MILTRSLSLYFCSVRFKYAEFSRLTAVPTKKSEENILFEGKYRIITDWLTFLIDARRIRTA